MGKGTRAWASGITKSRRRLVFFWDFESDARHKGMIAEAFPEAYDARKGEWSRGQTCIPPFTVVPAWLIFWMCI